MSRPGAPFKIRCVCGGYLAVYDPRTPVPMRVRRGVRHIDGGCGNGPWRLQHERCRTTFRIDDDRCTRVAAELVAAGLHVKIPHDVDGGTMEQAYSKVRLAELPDISVDLLTTR